MLIYKIVVKFVIMYINYKLFGVIKVYKYKCGC